MMVDKKFLRLSLLDTLDASFCWRAKLAAALIKAAISNLGKLPFFTFRLQWIFLSRET